MTPDIRPLATADEAAWRRLWQGYQDFYEVSLSEAVTAATWLRLLDPAEPVRGLIAERQGVVVGFAHYVLHRSTWRIEDTCYLQDLFVAPEARGTGLARRLVEAVYAASDAAGAGQVYWLTHKDNLAARRLYDRLAANAGFVLYERFAETGPATEPKKP